MPVVSVVRCTEYDFEDVSQAVRLSLGLIGGVEKFIYPGCKVFLKINHLAEVSPDCAVTTHPVVLKSILQIVNEAGGIAVVGDNIEEKFKKTGIEDVCRLMKAELINLKNVPYRRVSRSDNKWLKSVSLPEPVLMADCIINVPKLKTHAVTRLTGAVKNCYGFLTFASRVDGHRRYPGNEELSEFVVDLYALIRPHLNIMDAVYGMEGEGPMAGAVKKAGVIITGEDAVSVDAVSSEVIGWHAEDVLTTRMANDRGLGTGRIDSIEVRGQSIRDVRVVFKSPGVPWHNKIPKNILHWCAGMLVIKPGIRRRRCTGCADCCRRCPADAIAIINKKAKINFGQCLGCMCCQEVCRQKAVASKRKLLGRMILAAYLAKRAVRYVLLMRLGR